MSDEQATVTIGDIYKALLSLQNTCAYYAAALTGYYCAGISNESSFKIDAATMAALKAATDPEGEGDPPICDTFPFCFLKKEDFVKSVDLTMSRAQGVADALKVLIEDVDIPAVDFMAGSLPGFGQKPGQDK